MRLSKIIICISAFLMVSCVSRNEGMKDIETIYLNNSLPFNFSDHFDLDRRVFLETSEECLITYITKIIVNEDVFILDLSNQLFRFDKEGKFKNKIGLKGKGGQLSRRAKEGTIEATPTFS